MAGKLSPHSEIDGINKTALQKTPFILKDRQNWLPIRSQVSATVRRYEPDDVADVGLDCKRSSGKHADHHKHEKYRIRKGHDFFALGNISQDRIGIKSSRSVIESPLDQEQTDVFSSARFRTAQLVPPAKLRRGTRHSKEQHIRDRGHNVAVHMAQVKRKQANMGILSSSLVKREKVDPVNNYEQEEKPLHRFNPRERYQVTVMRDSIPDQGAATPFHRCTDNVSEIMTPLTADIPPVNHFNQTKGEDDYYFHENPRVEDRNRERERINEVKLGTEFLQSSFEYERFQQRQPDSPWEESGFELETPRQWMPRVEQKRYSECTADATRGQAQPRYSDRTPDATRGQAQSRYSDRTPDATKGQKQPRYSVLTADATRGHAQPQNSYNEQSEHTLYVTRGQTYSAYNAQKRGAIPPSSGVKRPAFTGNRDENIGYRMSSYDRKTYPGISED